MAQHPNREKRVSQVLANHARSAPVNPAGVATLLIDLGGGDVGLIVDRRKLLRLKPAMRRVLATLRPREADALVLRYGLDGQEPRTLREIGAVLGVGQERVRQMLMSALRKLRHPIRRWPWLRAIGLRRDRDYY
jgi:DNA-directed RNA polymerase specialized sigma24 family protein